MRPRLSAGQNGRISRSTPITFTAGFRFLELLHAGNCAARSNAGDKDIDLAVRILPDFLRRCFAVDLRIGRIVELLGDKAVFSAFRQLLGFFHSPFHPLGPFRQTPIPLPG